MEFSGSKVLFITHEDSHTGAPIAVLGILKILHEQYGQHPDVCVLAGKNGLAGEYKSYSAETFIYPEATLPKRIANRLLRSNLDYRKLMGRIRGYDIVVMSSIVSLNFFELSDLQAIRNLALCIFEMPVGTEVYLRENRVKLAAVKLFFSPSPVLTEALQANPLVKAPVMPLNQYIDADALLKPVANAAIPPVPDKPFIAGMIGAPGWPKGVDYFFCIAKTYFLRYPDDNVRFAWKGMQASPVMLDIFRSDVMKAGIADKVIFEGRSEHVGDFYGQLDVLALSSREDTYPNVMIEAALFSKPTISFDHNGGGAYFVGQSGGQVVPFLDILAYCDAIHNYVADKALLRAHGNAAHRFAMDNHCSRPLVLEQFIAGIKRLNG